MSRTRFIVASVSIGSALRTTFSIDVFTVVFFLFWRYTRIATDVKRQLFMNWFSISRATFFNIQVILEMRYSGKFRTQQLPSHDNNGNRAVRNGPRLTVTMVVIVKEYLVCQFANGCL